MSNVTNKRFEVLKKVFATLTMTATVLSLAGFAAFVPTGASAVAPSDYGLKEGDVVSAAGSDDPDVYIVNQNGFKRLFLNPAIFNFYGHLGGFAAVKNVSAVTRDAFGTSGLFQNCETNDPKVYGVEVTGEDVGMLHWVNTSGAQAVADDPNFFAKVFCINNNEFNWYAKGSDYTSVSQVPNYSRTPGQSTGPISVSLASDNPVSATLVATQAAGDLAHFNFMGSGTVTSLKLKRLGVSADATLSNVYLYDGNKRLTDAATVANGEISFNDTAGLFVVSGSKVISVKSDILTGTAGQTVGVQLISVNGNTVSVSGNLHTIATATLATVALAGTNGATPSVNAALDPADDVVVWQNTATIGNRYVWLNGLQARVIGSVLPGDLQNFRLFVDGVQQGASVAPDANGYVVFSFGSAVKLETGGRVLKIMANVVGGSSRNFTVSVRQATDVQATDSQYNVGVLATSTSPATFPVSAGQQTVAQGNLTITKKTDSPSGDIVKDASGVVLARYEFKATGENVKVENLLANATVSNGSVASLRNGALFADGVQIGSTQNLSDDGAGNTTYNLGSSLIIVPGTPRIVEIRADIFDGDGVNDLVADDTITANFAAGSSNYQRLVSLNYDSSPSAAGNQLTVKTGSFNASKYTGFADQAVVSPKTGVKLGHFTVTAASSEDVNVNTINLGPDPITGATFDGGEMTDLYIKVWNDAGSVVYTSPTKSTVSETASSSFSVNILIAKNKTFQVEVFANVSSGITPADSVRLQFDASGITTGSSTAVSTSVVNGQVITAQTGSLTKSNSSVPAATLAAGGTTKTAYAFTLQPQYDDFFLDEVYVDLATGTVASTTGAVANLILKEGSTQIASAVVGSTGSASFTGLNRSLAQADGTKTYTVEVVLASVGVGGNDTGGNVTVRLDGLKYRSSAGTITTENGYVPANFTGNAIVSHKAYPSVATVALPTTVLANGTQTIAKVTVTGNGGEIALKDLAFTISESINNVGAGNTFSAFQLFENGSDVTSLLSGSALTYTASVARAVFSVERPVSSATTYELKATLAGVDTTGESVSVSIANPSGSTSDNAVTYAVANATGDSIVWSDKSAAGHSQLTTDWLTDGLVKELSASQTMTK